MAPSIYASLCGHRVRDPGQVATYSNTDRVPSVQYCPACLLKQGHGRLVMERNDFGSIQGRLQSHFPEQRTGRDEYIKVEVEKNIGTAQDHNALESVFERGANLRVSGNHTKLPPQRERLQLLKEPKSQHSEVSHLEARKRVERLASDYRSTTDICPYLGKYDTKRHHGP